MNRKVPLPKAMGNHGLPLDRFSFDVRACGAGFIATGFGLARQGCGVASLR